MDTYFSITIDKGDGRGFKPFATVARMIDVAWRLYLIGREAKTRVMFYDGTDFVPLSPDQIAELFQANRDVRADMREVEVRHAADRAAAEEHRKAVRIAKGWPI